MSYESITKAIDESIFAEHDKDLDLMAEAYDMTYEPDEVDA